MSATIVIMIILSLIIIYTTSNMHNEIDMVLHIHDSMDTAHHLMANMIDQETGMRGFLATGDEKYLEPYNKAIEQFDDELEGLKEVVRDNPSQLERLNQIEILAERWHNEAAEIYMALKREIIVFQNTNKTIMESSVVDFDEEKMNYLRDELLLLESQDAKLGIIVSMLHIENSIKNYLLSHDLSAFDVYNESLTNIQMYINSLDNPDLIRLIQEWVDQAETKKDILLDESHQLKTDDDLKAELAKGQGKYLMDQIRDQIDIYVSVEESLLATRNQELKTNYQYSLVFIFVALALILLVGLIQVITTRRISRPLEKFSKKLRAFDPNNINDDIMFEKETFKEITELSNGYHKLIGELKSSQAIQKANESNIQSLLKESEQINKELALKSQELAIKVTKLEDAEKKLNELSKTDQLTQVNNRRGFDEYFEKEWTRGIRSQSAMSLLMIDIDLFKNFNDKYGHVEGDNCLKRVASVIEGTIRRPPDMAARYGGEEFVVLLPETDIKGALNIAERIRANVEALAIENKLEEKDNVVTISIGISEMIPNPNTHKEKLIRQADTAMYDAKNIGRNKCMIYK